jgi:small subunit ribosomal protein S17
MVGTVVSNKMDKTVVVLVERLVRHQMYHKFVRRRSKFAAHDVRNDCQIGDKVVITESRPISKNKRWQVSAILEKAA